MNEKIKTFDIEGVNDEKDIFGNVFSIGCIYDGKTAMFFYSPQQLIDMFRRQGGIFYAHYGADYDFKLLFNDIFKKYFVSIKVLNNKIGVIKVYRDRVHKKKLFELRDTQFLLSASLKKLGIAFDAGEKMNIDRSDIKSLTKEQEQEYVKSDCIILYDVLNTFLDEVGVGAMMPPMTLPQLAFRRWKETFNEKELRVGAKYDPDLRKAYYGGRVDVFSRFGKNLLHYDVNSMYPTAMKNYDYPCGPIIKTVKYHKKVLGVYHCKIDARHIKYPEYPFLPYRATTGKLLFPIGTWSGWYCSPEIDKAIELGYKVEVIEGFAFQDRCRPFNEYVTRFHKMKNENKGVKRTIAKLFLNSLYGKFGQRRSFKKVVQHKLTKSFVEKNRVYPLLPEFDLYQLEVEDCKPFSYVQISAFVTCYARIILYGWFEQVLSQGGRIFYCDTDSVICDVELKTDKNLGGMGLENLVTEGYFLTPKTYAYLNDRGDAIIRAKGFNVKSLRYEDYVKAFNGDLSGFVTKKAGMIGFFEAVKRKLNFDAAIFRKRTMLKDLSKREVCCDGVRTNPITI